MDPHFQTRHTLLIRARDAQDEKAWSDFTAYYSQFILKLLWCMHIPRQDMEEVSQEVLIKLWKGLPSYDSTRGPFRPWMSTVIRNAVNNYQREAITRKSRMQGFSETIPSGPLPELASEDDFAALVEKEWKHYITNLAMERLRKVFSGKAIEAFDRFLQGETVERIAEEMKIGVDTVYTLRNRVKKRLVVEIHALKQDLEL